MGTSLVNIAKQLKNNTSKKVQLIYAFNGTGKTRLSREFKELIAPTTDSDDAVDQMILARTKIIYYNSHTEDLFYWDNDLAHDIEPKLKIQPNSFTQWVLQEQGQDQNIITQFQRYTDDKLTPSFNDDFSEVRFSFQRGNEEQSQNIKISKSEESNFIWSLFYQLLKQVISVLNVPELSERETDQFNQLKYVFIDDPVSSLDESHIIELAVDLAQLIRLSDSVITFIITTHHPLFYNVLYNELDLKGKNKNGSYMLSKHEDETFELEEKKGDSNTSFSYHLYLKQLIEQAIEQNTIQRYHFMLLRNLYEKTANFLGYYGWANLLPEPKKSYYQRIINFTSHATLSNEVIAQPTEQEKNTIKFLLDHLIENYNFFEEKKVKTEATDE